MMTKITIPVEEFTFPGSTGCPGCGANLVMRYLLKALGERTIVTIPACCWAVMPGYWPSNCLKVPLLYCAFEATGAAISGLRAALDVKGVEDVTVVGFAGDGGTVDIGLQALSGAAERRTDAIYVMYDNEAYMNTGIQRSSSTPWGASTTTSPAGKKSIGQTTQKKDMAKIAVAHNIPYVATACSSFPFDLMEKVKKAAQIEGPAYLHVMSVCPTGWRIQPEEAIKYGRLAVDTCVFPLYEVEYGKYRFTYKPYNILPVSEYIKGQGRFRHLTQKEIGEIQARTTAEYEKLLKLCEED